VRRYSIQALKSDIDICAVLVIFIIDILFFENPR
jgi:hypothetical protein